MAGPSVMVRILGDASNLAKSFQTAGEKADGVAKTAQASFSRVLGMLNNTGALGPFGEILSQVNDAFGELSEHGKKVSDVMLGAGGALVGIGSLMSGLGSKEQAAHQQLDQAITNTGQSYAQYGSAIDDAIKHNEKFGDSSVATQNALQILTQATNDPAKALKDLSVATDLAAAKHESLDAAASQLGKTINGNTKLLKQFGINVQSTTQLQKAATTASTQATAADKAYATAKQKLADLEAIDSTKKKLTVADTIALRNAEQAVTDAANKSTQAHQKLNEANQALANSTGKNNVVTLLAAKVHGQAAAASDTFQGHLKALGTTIEDHVSLLSEKYGPTLQKVGLGLTGLGSIMKVTKSAMDVFKGAQEGAAAANEVMAASEDTVAVSEGLALWPILLIVAAVAALIAIAYVLYRNWNTIWTFIKRLVMDVWDWIKQNWPLLLGILLGPIALAAALIYKYWDQIKAFIIQVWNDILAFLALIPSKIAAWAKDLWHWITDEFNVMLAYLTKIYNDVWTWIANIPAKVSYWAAQLWHWISDELWKIIVWIANAEHLVWDWIVSIPAKVAGYAVQLWHWISDALWAEIQHIVSFADGIWNWITHVAGDVAYYAGGLWHWIGDALWNEIQGILRIADDVWNWLIGIPGKIAWYANGMWSAITQAFRSAINSLIDIWNSLHFTIGGWGIGPVHVPSITVGMPQIPHLAQGGLITQSGIAMVHQGERVIPAGARTGPAVVVQNAHFKEELDIEAFMRRAAWVVQSRGV